MASGNQLELATYHELDKAKGRVKSGLDDMHVQSKGPIKGFKSTKDENAEDESNEETASLSEDDKTVGHLRDDSRGTGTVFYDIIKFDVLY